MERRLTDEANHQIVETGQQALALRLADFAAILVKGDIANIVQPVLDVPVLPDDLQEVLG